MFFLLLLSTIWKIWCVFLIVDGFVFDKIRQDLFVQKILSERIQEVTVCTIFLSPFKEIDAIVATSRTYPELGPFHERECIPRNNSSFLWNLERESFLF